MSDELPEIHGLPGPSLPAVIALPAPGTSGSEAEPEEADTKDEVEPTMSKSRRLLKRGLPVVAAIGALAVGVGLAAFGARRGFPSPNGDASSDIFHITKELIEKVAQAYNESSAGKGDLKVFGALQQQIRERGYLHYDDLVRVAHWKSPRPTSLVKTNPPEVVEALTRQALGSTDPTEAVSILSQLRGIGVRTGSAILAVWDPDRYTVMDIRAVESLAALGKFAKDANLDDPKTYADYLDVCRRLAAEHNVHLRDLDKFLWKLSGNLSGQPG